MVTAGAPEIPDDLIEQLAMGGKLVIPVGDMFDQTLVRITKRDDGSTFREDFIDCRFVKLIGRFGWEGEES